MVLERLEAFANGFLRQAVHPKSLHGAPRSRLLHHPSLYEFALLPGIAAVDDFIGLLHQSLDDVELLLDAFVLLELDAEARWNHRQLAEAPTLPHRRVFVRLLEFAQMAERPSHLISVALQVAVLLRLSSEYIGYFTSHRGLLGYTNHHNLTI